MKAEKAGVEMYSSPAQAVQAGSVLRPGDRTPDLAYGNAHVDADRESASRNEAWAHGRSRPALVPLSQL